MKLNMRTTLHRVIFLMGVFFHSGNVLAQEFLPVLLVESANVSDSETFASLVNDINTAMREGHDIPLFLRAYESHTVASTDTTKFILSPSSNYVSLLENHRIFSTDSALEPLRTQLSALASFGAPAYLQAVRFDGTNTPGWLNNFYVETSDESRLLEKVSALAAWLKGNNGEPALINVFHVIAGQPGFTHLVSINLQNSQSMGAFLDSLTIMNWSLEYSDGSGSSKIIDNVIFKEMMP